MYTVQQWYQVTTKIFNYVLEPLSIGIQQVEFDIQQVEFDIVSMQLYIYFFSLCTFCELYSLCDSITSCGFVYPYACC